MKLSERALKDQLYEIADNDFALPEQAKAMPRALEMLPHLGSPDAELRDDLIYSTLATWILADKFEDDELKTLLKQLLTDEHIFFKLGETDTDSVFMRSFSMLIIPLILKDKVVGALYADNRVEQGVFSQENIPLLSAFANQAAIAISNARLFEKVQDELKEAQRQVQALLVEIDQSRVQEKVKEITESEYFQDLSSKVKDLRRRSRSD